MCDIFVITPFLTKGILGYPPLFNATYFMPI